MGVSWSKQRKKGRQQRRGSNTASDGAPLGKPGSGGQSGVRAKDQSQELARQASVVPPRPTPATGPSLLPTLPIHLLEKIAAHLNILQRAALTSCCRAVWVQRDVLDSPFFWGSALEDEAFVLQVDHVMRGRQPEVQASLFSWLERRAAGLRRLELRLHGCCEDQQGLYCSLMGSPLEELRLQGLPAKVDNDMLHALLNSQPSLTRLELAACDTFPRVLPCFPPTLRRLQHLHLAGFGGGADEAGLASLTGLGALSRLELVGSQLCRFVLPGPCPVLRYLDLSCSKGLGEWGTGAMAGLRHLGALTQLCLAQCHCDGLPREATCLTALADLDVTGSKTGQWGQMAWQLLPQLTSLTRLAAASSGLERLPLGLSALSRLAVLDASHNPGLGKWGQVALQPLQQAASLTQLSLAACNLRRVPAALMSLRRLADLDLSGNASLAEGGEHGFEPLAELGRLTRLVLSDCGLQRLPPALSGLSSLAELGLEGNHFYLGEGAGTAFQLLRALCTLSHLSLGCARLGRLPEELSALAGLRDLRLVGGTALGARGAAAFQPLRHATALTRLALPACGLRSVPPQLAALKGLVELELFDNWALGEASPEARIFFLPHGSGTGLQSLTRLSLAGCGLRRVPPELAALRGIAELDLSNNQLLGSGGAAALAPVVVLPALLRVDLSGCGLAGAPADVRALRLSVVAAL